MSFPSPEDLPNPEIEPESPTLQADSLPSEPPYGRRVGLSCSSDSKESACNAEDLGSIPGLGRSSGEGNDNPLQYSFLENLMDRGVLEGYSP